MNVKRVKLLNSKKYTTGQIVYWMSREQRVNDNWALHYAIELAKKEKTYVEVVFCLREEFPHNTNRMVHFMLKGLEEVAQKLTEKNIPFHFLVGDPQNRIKEYVTTMKVGALVCDFNPLRWHREWTHSLAEKLSVPVYQVDAHNVVPVWEASPKQEFGAYTIRPKLFAKREEFLDVFPTLTYQKAPQRIQSVDWKRVYQSIRTDHSVPEVTWLQPGEKAARQMLQHFIEEKLQFYDTQRNDPTKNALSLLSPYLHFGHLSAQTIALIMISIKGMAKQKESFLEELLVRKELSDNFCYYNKDYDNPNGFPQWAKETVQKHKDDPREFLYTRDQFENATTHDPLWNAAQKEMLKKGKMHGYMRMYWAKKIFEWSPTVEKAQETAIYLNDRYFLDGRDPNGYTGIAWSMGGVHDRAWFEREVFGKIRYMNYNGAKSKFDVKRYISLME